MIRKNGLPSDKLLPVLRDILRPALIWAALAISDGAGLYW